MDTPILLILILGSTALIIPAINLILKREKQGKAAAVISIISLSLSLLLIIYQSVLTPLDLKPSSSLLFRNDLMGLFFAFSVIIVSLFVTIASLDYMKNQPNESVYYSLILFTSLGMSLLAFSVDLILIAVSWELMSIPTYILTGFKKQDSKSNEAAIKYFIMGSLSTGAILYGISLVYGMTGTTNLFRIVEESGRIANDFYPMGILAMLLLVAGFGMK